MKREIEAKMKLPDVESLESRLRTVGAADLGTVLELNTYYDTPNGRLKSSDQGLRIRTTRATDGQETVMLTHKGPRAHGELKNRAETEVQALDAVAAAELLNVLGYTGVLSFEKQRRSWELDGCHIEIDTLPYLGHYVEIEGPSEPRVMAAREKLELTHLPLIRSSYISMLKTHLSEANIASNHISLDVGI